MRTCLDCGSRVYSLGCVNCDETAYIEEQRQLTASYGEGEMRGDFDEDEDPDFEPDSEAEDGYCHRCDNKGTIIVCVDDLCRGAGECMHGDGEIVCPDCKGESGDLL